ncbi:MAG: hypothetical protein HY293_05175 [Planctomycetes bacterium]|nr:hypothetical protein [Planctomycetota bacterium]
MALQRSNCANHPDRYGHAVCMTCRKTVCQECATEWDGVFYCSSCLGGQRRASGRRAPVLGWILVTLAAVALFCIGPKLLVWAATLLQRGVE